MEHAAAGGPQLANPSRAWSWQSRTIAGIGVFPLWAGLVIANWNLAQDRGDPLDPQFVLAWAATGVSFFTLLAVAAILPRTEAPLVSWITVTTIAVLSGMILVALAGLGALSSFEDWTEWLPLALSVGFGGLAAARWWWPTSSIPTIGAFTMAPLAYLGLAAALP